MPPTIALLLLSFASVSAKVYDRCELARELKYLHEFPVHEVATWVCIVAHESIYDTAAMNPGSGDHGLFQISQLYWCSPPGDGFGCNAPCAAFRDDNIADDVKCVRRIFKEHKRISGDGFNAWAVYPLYCKGDNGRYTRGCFDNEIDNSVSFGEQEVPVSTSSSTEAPDDEDDDEGYEFPPLPSPPKKTVDNAIGSKEDVYEFPPLPTTQRVLSYGFQAERMLKLFPNFVDTAFIVNTESNFFTVSAAAPLTELFLASSSYPTISKLTPRPPTLAPFRTSVGTKSTTAYFTKKPVTTKSTTSAVFIKPKQITFRPFFGRQNETVTLMPVIGPPRPPGGSRPSGGPRPPLLPRPSIRPPNVRSTSSRPHNHRLSKPTLRPFSKLTTNSNKNTVFASTTPLQSISTTIRQSISPSASDISTCDTKAVYTFSTLAQKSTPAKQSTVTFPSTTTVPVSTSTINVFTTLSKSSETKPAEELLPGMKTSSTPKPPNPGSNGNSLKREERRYDNEFPGYTFSRIGNGFRLVQKL